MDDFCGGLLISLEGGPRLPVVILRSTIRSRRSFLLAPAHPDGPGKRAVKRLWLLIYKGAFSALTLLVGWQEGHLACKN